MFDKAIIETDNFLNISMSAKALYFLLGMEADDEGFVSPNRVLRTYGGELGDVKNLIDTGLVIPFESGVLVITHWNENNYLDRNRIKKTQYQKERKMLELTESKKYELNNGSTSIEESRVEEKSIEGEIHQNQQPLFEIRSFGYVDEKGVSHETTVSEYEDWLNKEAWEEWVSFRKELRKKMTPRAIKSQWNFLKQYSKQDQALIIETSIRNSYQGLFPPKGTSNQKTIHAAR